MDRCLVYIFRITVIVTVFLVTIGCGNGAHDLNFNGYCLGYPNESSSDYILPYPSGESYPIIQGNCTGTTHSRNARYSYDFGMDKGDEIVAVRDGEVVYAEDENEDRHSADVNAISIKHSDGTVAIYAHIEESSLQVGKGDNVSQGDTLANAGSSGTAGAHLHFQINKSTRSSESIPVVFSNTSSHPSGLVPGKSYEAD